MPKLCMTRTINLSNTQFRYQLVFFIHMYGYIWLAKGCLWHLLPRQNLQCHVLPRQNLLSASFAWQNMLQWHLLTGGMILLIQCNRALMVVILKKLSALKIGPYGPELICHFRT